MDKTFRVLIDIMETWRRAGHKLPVIMMMGEILRYGLAQGFLIEIKKLDVGDKESDESVLGRACAAAALFQDLLGEDVGSVVDMTREQQLQLIRRAKPINEELMPILEDQLGIASDPPVVPKRVLH